MPALLAGLGIADLPDFIVGDAIASGELEVILKDWKQPEGAVHLVMHPAARAPPASKCWRSFWRSGWRWGRSENPFAILPRGA